MELLFQFMLPVKAEDGTYQFVAPLGPSGAVALIHLEDLGLYARWLFDNVDNPKINGLDLEIATEHVDWTTLAKSFSQVTGKKGVYLNVDQDEYFNKWYPAGPKAVGRKIGTAVDKKDPTLQTWRQNFGGFWNIWKYSGGNVGIITRDYDLLDEILPQRVRTVKEWMIKVGYTGEPKRLLKDWADGGIGERNGQNAAVKL